MVPLGAPVEPDAYCSSATSPSPLGISGTAPAEGPKSWEGAGTTQRRLSERRLAWGWALTASRVAADETQTAAPESSATLSIRAALAAGRPGPIGSTGTAIIPA